MSILAAYLADPPQLRRIGGILKGETQYLVGDRITESSSGYRTYVCTTGGISGAVNMFGGGTPTVTWGSTVWASQDPLSWETAATSALSTAYGLWYVDAYSQVGYMNPPTGGRLAIMVDPNTMEPTRQQPVFTYPAAGGESVGVDVLFAARGGTYAEDYHVRLPNPSDLSSYSSNVTAVDARNVRIGAPATGSRGCEFLFKADSSVAVPALGRACNVRTFGGATGAQPILTTTGEYCHVATHNSAAAPAARSYFSTYYTDPLYYTSVPVYASVDSEVSDLGIVAGHYNTLMVDYGCYRVSSFSAGETPHSYELATVTTQTESRPSLSAWFLLPTTLTGARTVSGFLYTEAAFSDLNNSDVWMEVMYPPSASSSHLTLATSMPANYGALTPAGLINLTVDAASTWYEGYTLTELLAYKISVPITIGRGGLLYVRYVVMSARIHEFPTFFCPNIEIA